VAAGTILVGVVFIAFIVIVFVGAVRMVAKVARDLGNQKRWIRSDRPRRRSSRPKNRRPPV
jgi:hypothetical protein